jgi:hypothetical protein
MLSAVAFPTFWTTVIWIVRNAAIIPAPVVVFPSVVEMVSHTRPFS